MKEQAPQTTIAVQKAINHFQNARHSQRADVEKMEEITGDILRCQQQKQDAEARSEQAGNQWREMFRKLRGQISPEIKQQHLQRMAEQEMARELGELLDSLNIQKERQEVKCSTSGEAMRRNHGLALMDYGTQELTHALSNAITPLVRAMAVKYRALAIEQSFVTQNGHFNEYAHPPLDAVVSEVNEYLKAAVSGYAFNMHNEPVLSQIGLSSPEAKYLNPKLTSVGGRTMALTMIKRKEAQLGIGGQAS
ncbi:hypothetical protein [Rahnella inusitata]|uniref:Glycoprotein 3 n=1 Tax=Rahnella inusitata TaxID=58169 RepID=A0ABX9P3V8_9GAMM|nr:hypothetical protein [Rahnella inusitata]RJT15671.1 hypothetical protein D5396_00660 [Rahnella inusitata]